MEREKVAGPDSGPSHPFPMQLSGRIVKGFGRGSSELGIPTANLPISGLEVGGFTDVESGVYFGWAGVSLKGAIDDSSKAAEPLKGEAINSQSTTASTAHRSAASTNSNTASYPEPKVYQVVLSIGYNPFYKNEVRSVEVHVMQKFEANFYNAMMNLSIEGFIRQERNYDSMQDLIDDINTDIEVARRSLDREAYIARSKDSFLLDFAWGD